MRISAKGRQKSSSSHHRIARADWSDPHTRRKQLEEYAVKLSQQTHFSLHLTDVFYRLQVRQLVHAHAGM